MHVAVLGHVQRQLSAVCIPRAKQNKPMSSRLNEERDGCRRLMRRRLRHNRQLSGRRMITYRDGANARAGRARAPPTAPEYVEHL